MISGDGGGAVLVHQDANVYVSALGAGARVDHGLEPGRGVYLYLIESAIRANDEKITTGDAARIWDEARITLEADESAELIMVEVRLA